MCGDGTRGWPAHAPFDAILVSAGGPDVPPSLLEQLAIGGRIVVPVGDRTHAQELLKVTRVEAHEYVEQSLGRVQFVPLVGAEGWRAGAPTGSPPREVHVPSIRRHRLARRIHDACLPFASIATAPLDALLERCAGARVVLIGEASHGTSEFYRMRARITRGLIDRHGFNVVGLEADWPDTSMLDRYVRGWEGPGFPDPPFARFPTWMWRNRETLAFVDWLAGHNRDLADETARVSLHGLDLYSLYSSIQTVVGYLDRVDPAAAERARRRFACFSPWEREPAIYGRAVVAGERKDCEDEVVETLLELLSSRLAYRHADGEALFDTEQNARVVRSAERYYRIMYYGSRASWNLRDTHMFETLRRVMEARGGDARAVVWAHNSHIGDAAATEMSARGEFNIGQLCREFFGAGSCRIGFGTDHGTVAAASNWDGPMEVKQVRPGHAQSYERLFHMTEQPGLILSLRGNANLAVVGELAKPRLERAIGVIYRPETEVASHYFEARLSHQFDEYIWVDSSTAVTPLTTAEMRGMPDTYPFGV
jgi:protein-L-isoaspartate(D-aspartate) O-methyltransferase